MFKALLQCAVITLSLLPTIGRSETIKLKLSFFSSDQSPNYLAAIKPFVEAVNREAKGILEIQTFLSGSLGKNYPDTAQLVQSGVADFGFVNPGLTPDLFPDTAVIELPALFRDTTEASLVYTRMVATGSLKDEYELFFVVAAVGAGPQGIHVRDPITSLHDMKGLKIRSSNQTEGLVLAQLGMKPQVIPINRTTAALAEGAIDG